MAENSEKITKIKRPAAKKSSAAPTDDRRKLWHFLAFLLIFSLLVGGSLAAIFALNGALFSENERFVLREVLVDATGYWKDRAPQLSARLHLRPGQNLFRLNPREIRRELENIPGVESCEVRRELPDRIWLRLVERIPRAVLGNPRSPWVVDEAGVPIPRTESMVVAGPLPIIVGMAGVPIEGGKALPQLKEALLLVMASLRNYPDISILWINIRHDDRLDFIMSFRGMKKCRVLFPRNREKNLNFLLNRLQSAVIAATRRGDPRSTFDMTFDGNVIIR